MSTTSRDGRLLIVEDEPADALVVRALLSEAGGPSDTICVASLAEAIESIRGGDVAAVLLDLGLPDADGLEALAGILHTQPDLSVIVLTGRDDDELGMRAVSAGAQDYLVKGKVSGELLVRALRYADGRSDAVHAIAHMAAIVESSDDAIFSTSLTGEVRTWNRGAEQLYGFTAEEMIGQEVWPMVPPELWPETQGAVARLASGDLIDHFETRGVRKDGSTIDVSVQASPILEHGAVVGVSIVARNISARREAEVSLARSEARLAEAQRVAGVGSWWVDVQSGRLQWSDELFRQLGYEPGEVEPTLALLFERVHPDDREGLRASVSLSFTENRTSDREHRVVLPDGSVHWHAVHTVPVVDDDGVVVSVHGTAQDVTQAREREAQVRFQAQLLSAVGESIVASDLSGVISYWGPGAEALYGWTAEEAVGRTVYDVVPTRLTPAQALDMRDHHARGESWTAVVEVRRRDGSWFLAQITNTPVVDAEGHTIAITGLSADVSVREEATARLERARDHALEASLLKSNFITNVSHEIRTPMNGVLGMTELLLETPLDARQLEYAEAARDSADSLLHIINDLLDISKIEAGQLALESIDFSTATVIQDVAESFAAAAEAKGVELVVDIDDDLPVAMRGDPLRLRQVLTNLLANAVKFTNAGHIAARCRVVTSDLGALVVRLEIEDTGIGMAPATAARVFEPFAQADSSTTRVYGGTGLGLSITRQLVELMDGKCGVVSELGSGSTFWVELSPSPAGRRGATFHLETYSDILTGTRILVADDNAVVADVVARYLRWSGAEVTTVGSGAASVAAIGAASDGGTPFEVAVVDMQMPDMTGLEVASTIAALDIARPPAIVVMTTSTNDRALVDIGSFGIVGELAKPIARDLLRRRISEIVSGVDSPDKHVTPDEATPGRGVILLAEDNPINQKVVAAMLTSEGYAVSVVNDGRKAADAARSSHYDVVLMDCQMPKMDGYEATAAIRAEESTGARVPIVALTASAMAEDKERCLSAGMDDYLAKPVPKAELLAAIARWVPATQAS
ncbi:MAG: hypothetical protein QOJ00_1230 [Actinomycetota bacterium]